MNTSIFINIKVTDLAKSIEFYEKLGYKHNAQFTDETASSIVISDTIYVMLLTEDKMKDFTQKELVDAHKATEVLLALSVENKDAVNKLVEKALAAGGKEPREAQDLDFMYSRAFEDLDGHIWEVFYMDPDYLQS